MSVESQATNSSPIEKLITEHIDIWSSAIKRKSSSGRGSSKKIELYGIKKLRELILELAVRGKLVAQDASDEPASILLERIAQEKAQLVKEGKIKKSKKLPLITEDEKPFELPKGWEWVNLSSLITLMDAGWSPACPPEPSPNNETWGVLKTTAVQNMQYQEYENKVLSATKEPKPQYEVKVGDILITRAGPKNRVGVSCLVQSTRPQLMISDKIIRFHLIEVEMSERFVSLCLNAGATAEFLETVKSGMAESQMNISQDKLKIAPIPLAPIEEQHRIVAKVDELMALCDQLEAQTESSLDAHQTLVTALLDTLVSSQNAEELAENWTRISDHFDTLFTTEHSIDQLKQTILQLAVMGKLVEQASREARNSPNYEPASVLLERIAAEKEELVKQKKIKKQKPLPPIAEDEKPFELPEGWEWCRVNDLLSLKNGYAFKSKFFDLEIGPYVLATPGNFYETGGFRDRGNKTKYYNGPVQDDFLLEAGDLIIPLTEQAPGLLGSAAFIPDDGKTYLHNQRLAKLSPLSTAISKRFVALFFNCPFLRSELAKTCSGTTVRHSSPDRVLQTLMPIVSLEEQHRIVAKVDELMVICDQLKAQLSEAQTTQLNLADALVEKAL